ncbi:tRNA pseudouridine(38-40) synthase [Shuttleworthella sp. MSX8B]|nr:tRNA pseudouridine(38-40) synthase TruA [Shuttleworthia sp. MSX8B]EUB18809.1 tRNA pseudouridine(38-40) synthase [Shuttleworthia sp. MSX8B]
MRVRATIAYDGTEYCGWQVQPNGISVQEVVNAGLSKLLSEEITCVGASRTDAGVHSMGNEILFETKTRIPADKIAYALNQYLPEDIVCQGSSQAADDFHPRFSESYKTYEYRILNRRFPMPTMRRDSLFYHYDLDEKRMQEAADCLLGEHDFSSFASIHAQSKTRVRTIYQALVSRNADDLITIRLCGDGFLYNMVRIIAGTLIEVGAGITSPRAFQQILEGMNRELAGPTAPAHGLTQVGLHYLTPEEIACRKAGGKWPFLIDSERPL